mmetsp:Transcript_56577/g.132735  ORF Transcript_56577/g.132735 Transcript_56577/m.132735 type:complete len:200 (+) Transcript_56577:50-649(+)
MGSPVAGLVRRTLSEISIVHMAEKSTQQPEGASDPHLETLLHQQLIAKEKKTLTSQRRWANRQWGGGDIVMLAGMKTRPHLNGACGEVICKGGDEGFVTVRVFDKDGASGIPDEPKKWKTMSVHPGRLRPLWNSAWQIQAGSSPVIPVSTTLLGTTGGSSVGGRSSARSWTSATRASSATLTASSRGSSLPGSRGGMLR